MCQFGQCRVGVPAHAAQLARLVGRGDWQLLEVQVVVD